MWIQIPFDTSEVGVKADIQLVGRVQVVLSQGADSFTAAAAIPDSHHQPAQSFSAPSTFVDSSMPAAASLRQPDISMSVPAGAAAPAPGVGAIF